MSQFLDTVGAMILFTITKFNEKTFFYNEDIRIYLPNPRGTIRRKEEIESTGRANEANPVKFANGLTELLARIKSVQEYALFANAALAPNSNSSFDSR